MNNKKLKQICTYSLLFILLFSNFNLVSAKEIENQQLEQEKAWELENNEKILKIYSTIETDKIPSLYWKYTIICDTGLSILGNGNAICGFSIITETDVDHISSYMYLQKKNGSVYETIANGTWNQMVYSTINILDCEKQLSQRGTYRVFVVHYVYGKDGGREVIELTSYEKTY